MLPPGFSRETRIRRDARGHWFEDEVAIEHRGISRAFDRWVGRAEDGRYILENSINWAYVEIEGAPLFVRQLILDAEGARVLLSDDRVERLNPATLRQAEDGALYCDARAGTMVASFDRGAAMELSEALDEDDEGLYVALGAQRWRVPVVSDPLASAPSAGESAPSGA